MTRLILAAVLCFVSTGAIAQSTVRSGEHPTFTRLVIPIAPATDWTLGRTDGGYILRLDPVWPPIDLTGVFDRIPKDRLQAIRQIAPSDLMLAVTCDCHAQAFLFQRDRLVIDIVDGPGDAPRFEARLSEPTTPAAPIVPAGSVLPLVFDPPTGQTDRIDGETAQPLPAELPSATVKAAERQERIDAIAAGIIESLGRAGSQGLLELATEPSSAPAVGTTVPSPTPNEAHSGEAMQPTAPSPLPTALQADPLGSVTGFTVQTSIDRDRPRAVATPSNVNPEGLACLPDTDFAINSWGDDRDFSTQIADRRARLTGEFDLMPEGAIEELAKTYLYFGFGREARQALELDGRRSRERDVLSVIGAVMEGDADPVHVLRNHLSCDGAVALWALLAERGETGGRPINTDAVRQAYSALPDDLRTYLGPMLAQSLIAAGQPEAARQVLGASDPKVTEIPPEAKLAIADVAVEQGDQATAITELAGMAKDDPRMTPEALAKLFELALDEHRSITPDLLLLSQSLRFEYRDDPAKGRLAAAEARLLSQSGNFAPALELVQNPANALAPETQATLHADIVGDIRRNGDDPTFLRYALGGFPFSLPAEEENLVAARLLGLGFPEQAASLLSGEAQGEAMGERRYLRAEAALASGQPDAALAAIAGLTDPRADRLRRAATSSTMGLSDQPAASADAAGASVDQAWREGSWSTLATSEDPLLRSVADAMIAAPSSPAAEPSLSASEAALAAADNSSNMINDLLNRFVVSPDPTATAGGL